MGMKHCGEIMIPLDRFPQLPYWFTLRQAMAELARLDEDREPHSLRLTSHRATEECPGVDDHRESRYPCSLVLVFDAQNQLLGMLRQHDILRGLKPDIVTESAQRHAERLFDVKVDPNLYKFCNGDRALNMLREQIERPIGDFARPIDLTLNYDDDLLPTIGLMIDRDIDFIPVLQDNRIAGILSMLDVLQETTRLLV